MWNKIVAMRKQTNYSALRLSTGWTLPPFPFGSFPPRFWWASASEKSHRRFRKVSVKGDGRCLFRAIAKCLAHNEGRALPEHLEVADADALRREAYKIICVEQRAKFEKNMLIEGNIRHYCQELLKPSFYGGEPEIWVLSEVFQVPIQVYLQTEDGEYRKIVEYGKQFWNKGGGLPVCLLYNGINHYDALFESH
ncbi:hypothetical protein GpartN1_g1597.t1 [Galdieria partita]|uniref:Ubiquitin thioesterase OTU n=1 Tax=Galdieria partita TaxID=83374 RepID=A0A9C7UNS7_9RHOD|nr:hypothetical protein GpartN1_g1597.t1 [Galdieria partita]